MGTEAVINLLAVGEGSPVNRTAVTDHYALRVRTSQTNTFWFLGNPDDRQKILDVYPGADIRKALLASVPSFQEDGGFLSGEISIGSGSYSLADIDHDAATVFAERASNRQALKGAELTLFQAADEENFTEDTRIRTSLGDGLRDDEGEMFLDFESIHTLLRGKLFTPTKLKIARALEEEDDVVILQFPEGHDGVSPVDLPAWQHDDAYSTDPGLTISYWKTPESEVISTTDTQAKVIDGKLQFNIREREMFGSFKKQIPIADDTIPANYPEIEEFPFLEETPGDMLLITLAGRSADGRIPPANWTRNLGLELFNLASFDYTGGTLERQHFKGLKEQDTKTFVDKRILGEVFATLLDDELGRFELRSRAGFTNDAVSVEILDENNLDIEQEFSFQEYVDSLRRVIFIKHGHNALTGEYELADIKLSSDTLPSGIYGELEDIDVEFQGWNTAVGTISQLYIRAGILQDLYHAKLLKIEVKTLPHMHHVRVGDIVTLDLRRVPVVYNSNTGEPLALVPFLSMLVVARGSDGDSGANNLALIASTGSAERQARGGVASVLDDSEYDRIAPDLLSDFLTPTAGTGGRELYDGTIIVPPDRWYRIDNQAILGPDFKMLPSGFGEFLGIAHKAELTVLSTVGAINTSGSGVYDGTRDTRGNPGFIGTTTADGKIHAAMTVYENSSGEAQQGTVFLQSRPQTTPSRATQTTFTGFNLVMIANRLRGILTRLSGSGGQGGGLVSGSVSGTGTGSLVDNFIAQATSPAAQVAAKGGRGGMAALYMGRLLGWGANAVLCDVSGGDGEEGTFELKGAVAGSGAGGAPSVLGIIVDGNHTLQTLNASNVRAFNGSPAGSTPHASLSRQRSGVNGVQSWYRGTDKANRWRSHSAITYIPASDDLGDRPLNAFDQLALDEAGFDGKITLHLIPDTTDPQFPGSADVNDLAIYEVDARDQNLNATSTRIYRLTSTGWVRVVFPDLVAEFKISDFRNRGSTVTWVRETRPPIGVYAVGDSWYHPGSRRMYTLGATPEFDVLIGSDTFSDHTGFNLLVDPSWVDYASGKDTLSFQQRWDEPLRTESSAPTTTTVEVPGQTSDQYIAVSPIGFSYEEDGAVQWQINAGDLESSAAASTGHARAFFGTAQGFIADNDERKVWAYARTTGGTGTLIVQGAGSTDGVGTPAQQQSVSVTSTAFSWVELPGLFGAFHSQLQLRTPSIGLVVQNVILIDKDSVSVPEGTNGFGASGVSASVLDRPFWAAPTTDDRRYPLQRGASRGPFQLLDTGEGNSLAWRVDFSGANVPNIITERFPAKGKPGTQYRATVRMKINVSNGFSLPDAMGVGLQIEGFNDRNESVFTTGIQDAGDARDWFSINGSNYTDLVQIVDVPKNVNRLAWIAMKVAVMGDASGYAEIDSCEFVELPYRVEQFFASNLTYLNFLQGSTSINTKTRLIGGFEVDIKKGMRVSTRVEGFARIDQITDNDRTPRVAVEGRFSSVDLFGNFLAPGIGNPEIAVHRASFGAFQPKLGINDATQPPFISTANQPFSGSSEFIAATDIRDLIIEAKVSRGDEAGSNHLFLEDLTYVLIYGENFGEQT